jgi:hypothetical protein
VPAIWRTLHRRLHPTTWTEYGGLAASQVAIYDFSPAQLQANYPTQRFHTGHLAVATDKNVLAIKGLRVFCPAEPGELP